MAGVTDRVGVNQPSAGATGDAAQQLVPPSGSESRGSAGTAHSEAHEALQRLQRLNSSDRFELRCTGDSNGMTCTLRTGDHVGPRLLAPGFGPTLRDLMQGGGRQSDGIRNPPRNQVLPSEP